MLPSYGAEEVEAAISHAVSPGSSQRTIEEFNALVDRLIVPADGRNREELAQSWLDAVGDVIIHQVTPGSKYENSFVQNRVTVESAEPAAGLYDPELLAGQHFTFTNERIFVPGNYRSKEQQTVNSQLWASSSRFRPSAGTINLSTSALNSASSYHFRR